MREYADQAAMSGVFPDPRTIYDLTPQEISVAIRGANERTKQMQKANNIRAGTICACIYNQNRRKRNDRIWKWSDFFPERDLRQAADPKRLEEEALKIMKMFNGGD